MTNYGYLIVKNPGPSTEIEIAGMNGPSDHFDSEEEAYKIARIEAAEGDMIRLLVVVDTDKPSGVQLYVREKPLEKE
jgi:hypothetical protein